jgi:hypothetical protein
MAVKVRFIMKIKRFNHKSKKKLLRLLKEKKNYMLNYLMNKIISKVKYKIRELAKVSQKQREK